MTERIEFLPLSALRESPFNPRKTYPEAELQALADSIATQGVLQPIVVRPLPDGQADIEHTHELVFGHRRFRAAQRVLEEIPCIVRDMSDQAAAIAQTHENAKRADVTPFEEADSFQHLMTAHGMTAEQVAKAVDMSRSYVYGRIKLANASPAVRQACSEQALPAEIALYLARIPHPKLQAKALATLKDYNGEWLSVRDAKRKLDDGYTIRLNPLGIDIYDAELARGAGACTACPKFAANDPELVDQPADLCLEPDCARLKQRLQMERLADQREAEGHTVLRGEALLEAMPNIWNRPEGYSLTSSRGFTLDGQEVDFGTALQRLPEAERPRLLYALETRSSAAHFLNAYVSDADLAAMRQALGCTRFKPAATDDEPEVDPHADWPEAERLATQSEAVDRVRHALLAQLLQRPRSTDDLRLVLRMQLDAVGEFEPEGLALLGLDAKLSGSEARADAAGEDFDQHGWLLAWLDTATADELGVLLMAEAICYLFRHPAYGRGESQRRDAAKLVHLASRLGIDIVAVQTPAPPPAEPTSTPSPAARAKKGAGAEAQAAAAPPEPKLQPVAAWPFPKKVQKDNAVGSAAVEHAEAGA